MLNELKPFLPDNAFQGVQILFKDEPVSVIVKQERKTRFGDYRMLPNGKHLITVNGSLNQYRFLVTLVHEFAHYKAYKKFGTKIKPHGKEWKATFKYFMLPFLNPKVFPLELLPVLANYFKNPKASTATDVKLLLALKQYDAETNKTYIFEVPKGVNFRIQDGREFKMIKKRVKRYECLEIKSGRLYLFNASAEVEIGNHV